MRYYGYKTLLFLLRGLIHLKRGTVWFGKRLGEIGGWIFLAYRNTIGYRLHKYLFLFQKKIHLETKQGAGSILSYLGKRRTLEAGLLAVAFLVAIPHTKLYTQESVGIPGRETPLYKLVGPGELEASVIQEITIEESLSQQIDAPSWAEGAARVETFVNPLNTLPTEPTDIAGMSAGGSAITKPTIIGDTSILDAAPGAPSQQKRTAIVQYTVEGGDTVSSIAERFGISISTILWANNLSARSYIRPGDTLSILPTNGVVHQVKKGETVSKIARQYDVPASEIIAFNKLQKDGGDIVIGEKLIVPGGEIAALRITPIIPRQDAFGRVAAPPPSITAPAGSGYLWPTSVRRITQYFGWRHNGLDIAGPVGTPIYAARAGTVVQSQCMRTGYGCHIIIDHGGGVQTLYAHNSRLYTSVGDVVTQGQIISLMGSTGRSTGPHVHFEVRVGRQAQNPLRYIR